MREINQRSRLHLAARMQQTEHMDQMTETTDKNGLRKINEMHLMDETNGTGGKNGIDSVKRME